MSHENVSPIPGSEPESTGPDPTQFMAGTDDEFGEFLEKGNQNGLRGSKHTALTSAQALCEVLSALDEGQALDKVPAEHWSRVAWMASTLIERAKKLDEYQEARSHG